MMFVACPVWDAREIDLTGPQRDYPPLDWNKYVRGSAVAVTTYSAVFNTNPRIDNAETLVKTAPEIPPGLYNRARMNWRPLLAIAERAGWKRAAWKAALAIEEVRDASDPAIVAKGSLQ